MKIKNLIPILLAMPLILTADMQEDKIKDFVKLVDPNAKLLNYTRHNVLGGIYQVRTNKNEFVVSKDFNTMFPAKNSLLQKNKKEQYEQLFIPYDMTKNTNESSFKIGQGKTILFSFISPTCVFSNNLFKNIMNNTKLKSKYTIYFFFYLLKDTNNNYNRITEQLANHINLQNTNQGKIFKYYEIVQSESKESYNFLKLTQEQRDNLKADLNSNYQLAKLVGAVGTPNIFTANAKPFYFSKEEL